MSETIYITPGHAIDLHMAVSAYLNGPDDTTLDALKSIMADIAEKQEEQRDLQDWRDRAERVDGHIEVDENAIVSLGEDGAYVQAWLFVDFK